MSNYRCCVLMPTPSPANLAAAGAWRTVPLSSTARRIFAMLTVTALSVGLAQAQDAGQRYDKSTPSPSTDPALLKKLEQMEQRIRALENELKQKDASKAVGAHAQA